MNTVINKFYTGDLNKFGFGTWNSGEQNLKQNRKIIMKME